MATENISTGNFYRILKDKATSTWDRISFWTHASDVELSSGTSLETDLSNKTEQIEGIQSDFAQIEPTSVSSHVYTKGMMLVYNNQLYRVTSAIASGETLVVGTNIESASVGTLANMLTASNGNQFYLDVKDGTYGFYPSASKLPAEFVPFGGSGLLQPIRIEYLPYVSSGNVCVYPSSLYGTKMYFMVLSNHYAVESHTQLTWSCDTGTITYITEPVEIGDTTTQAVKYEGNGTLTLLRKSGNNNIGVVGVACTPQYDNFDIVGMGNGGNGSCTVDISTYGSDFILWGIQFDYQCTSKLTVTTNDSGVTINPYMSPLYLGYSRGAISAYHIKSSGTGTLTVSWTANSNRKLGTTRIMIVH